MAKIKCKECYTIAEETEEYCPECGALFIAPFTYVEEEKKKIEAKVQEEIQKSSAEKTAEEKLNLLNEKCADIRDELNKLDYDIKIKSDECMRCFTAAGIGRAKHFDDDMANKVFKRSENFTEIDFLQVEYKKILTKMETKMAELEAAKAEVDEFKKNNPV